jgi:hypothetical protein
MQTVHTREIVVARYNEDISWLLKLPSIWKITVYNKGGPLPPRIHTHPNLTVIPLQNKGREAETIAHHLLHRYDSAADLTIFLQGSPFLHAPELLDCVNALGARETFSEFENYIPMAPRYDDKSPPPHITENRENRFFRVEEISTYTLDGIYHVDNRSGPWVRDQCYTQYNLLPGSNIMRIVFDSLGWSNAIAEGVSTIKFSYAACFAVTKNAIRQHPQEFYRRLYNEVLDKPVGPWLFEKAWLHIFNQNFDGSKVLPEFSLQKRYILTPLPKRR